MLAKSQDVRDIVVGDCQGYRPHDVNGKGVFGRVGLQTKRSHAHKSRDIDVVLCTENPIDTKSS